MRNSDLRFSSHDVLGMAITTGQFGDGGARRLRHGDCARQECAPESHVVDYNFWCVRCLPESEVDGWPAQAFTADGRLAQVSAQLEH